MKILQVIIFILLSISVSGQLIITGIVKDYHNQEILPFVSINADTIFYNREKFTLLPPDTATTNLSGCFAIKIKNPKLVNLTFDFIGYVPLTIKSINVEAQNQYIDLGVIYLPFRGHWIEGYKPPKGDSNRQLNRKQRKEWRKSGIPNWGGYVDDFLEPYQGKQNIIIEYPLKGSNKNIQLKGERLIIDYEEFIKK
jgi:hypothetical protein